MKGGSWHRYERSNVRYERAPGLTTRSKKLLGWMLDSLFYSFAIISLHLAERLER